MKYPVLIGCLYVLITGCNHTNSSKAKAFDTAYSTFNASDDIVTQIRKAKHNKVLIPGKWKIIKNGDRNGRPDYLNAELKKMKFDVYDFISDSYYAIYKERKLVEKGTFEWMANDREIVFTPDDNQDVSRLLIWNINDKYLKVSTKSSYMVFVKMRRVSKNRKE